MPGSEGWDEVLRRGMAMTRKFQAKDAAFDRAASLNLRRHPHVLTMWQRSLCSGREQSLHLRWFQIW